MNLYAVIISGELSHIVFLAGGEAPFRRGITARWKRGDSSIKLKELKPTTTCVKLAVFLMEDDSFLRSPNGLPTPCPN